MNTPDHVPEETGKPLRRGWTTGACAAAAAKAAYHALVTGDFPDPVRITLPKGQTPEFALAEHALGEGRASAAIIKDAGDDPDVTHGATIRAAVRAGEPGTGVTFHAGPGVGVVTKPGLPLAVGEPAINPVPRALITQEITGVAARTGAPADVAVTISVDDGEHLAAKTWNPRLGIIGGISILGTTGIVIPYSCSAWIHSIHQGVDVARAAGLDHVAACTGSTSERTARQMYDLPDYACIDMGDFAGGTIKYLRRHPIPRITFAGGFGKLCKLADGHRDLHSKRSQVDFAALANRARACGAAPDVAGAIEGAGSAGEALQIAQAAGVPLPDAVARDAHSFIRRDSDGQFDVEVVVIDRQGTVIGRAPFGA